MKLKDVAILVPSCDAYADTWKPFFHFFYKAWPDCPFDVYLGTNHLDFDHPGVKVIKAGADRSWAEGVKKMLREANREHVLLCLEDYFFYEIDAARVIEAYDIFLKLHADYLQLTPTPNPDLKVPGYPSVGRIKNNAHYKTAIGFQFWKTDTFLGLLRDGESAWDMELHGSERTGHADSFYRYWKPAARFHNAIVSGKWQRSAVQFCADKGVELDLTRRQVYTAGQTVWIAIKSKVRRFIRLFPDPIFLRLYRLMRSVNSIIERAWVRK